MPLYVHYCIYIYTHVTLFIHPLDIHIRDVNSKGDNYPYSDFSHKKRATIAEVLHYVYMYVLICVIEHGVKVIVMVIRNYKTEVIVIVMCNSLGNNSQLIVLVIVI